MTCAIKKHRNVFQYVYNMIHASYFRDVNDMRWHLINYLLEEFSQDFGVKIEYKTCFKLRYFTVFVKDIGDFYIHNKWFSECVEKMRKRIDNELQRL
jgi:hypothetical protein